MKTTDSGTRDGVSLKMFDRTKEERSPLCREIRMSEIRSRGMTKTGSMRQVGRLREKRHPENFLSI